MKLFGMHHPCLILTRSLLNVTRKYKESLIFRRFASPLPDAFIDTAKLTKSYIPAANTLARINITIGKTAIMAANETSMTRLKRGRPLGSKDLIPRKRKTEGQLISAQKVLF